jgi:hypothetical protein
MLIKIFWQCGDIRKEVYAIRKGPTAVSGFIYPIALHGHKYLPHWTYHSDRNREPLIHHRSRSGRILKFMTLQEPYLQKFQSFKGIVWSAPSFGAPFLACHAINVKGHPEEAQKNMIFQIKQGQIDWTHYLHILLIQRDKCECLYREAVQRLADGYHVIAHEEVHDSNEPNILVVFSQNRVDKVK